jgi:uncharacterized membrane protein YobD (UPF0266 family)
VGSAGIHALLAIFAHFVVVFFFAPRLLQVKLREQKRSAAVIFVNLPSFLAILTFFQQALCLFLIALQLLLKHFKVPFVPKSKLSFKKIALWLLHII